MISLEEVGDWICYFRKGYQNQTISSLERSQIRECPATQPHLKFS